VGRVKVTRDCLEMERKLSNTFMTKKDFEETEGCTDFFLDTVKYY
jgi:hypothetical protein